LRARRRFSSLRSHVAPSRSSFAVPILATAVRRSIRRSCLQARALTVGVDFNVDERIEKVAEDKDRFGERQKPDVTQFPHAAIPDATCAS
jgi:hypothetical protein